MGNIIVVLIIIILIVIAIMRIRNTIKNGGSCCSSATAPAPKIRVNDKDRSHYPYKYLLKVEGMVCSGCVRNVENAINSEGDMWAKVDLEHKEVTVLAKRQMSRNGFIDILKDTPYTLMDMADQTK